MEGSSFVATSPSGKSFIESHCSSPSPTGGSATLHDDESISNSLFIDVGKAHQGSYSNFSHSDIRNSTPSPSIKLSPQSISPKSQQEDNVSSIHTLASSPCAEKMSHNLISPNKTPSDGKLGTFSAINIILSRTIGVGIYSVPSSVFNSAGSVGASILLWIIGAFISFCGLAVYLDLGTGIPLSGGERVYLDRIFRKPHKLTSCIFMAYTVLLGFSAPNCIVFGEYAMYSIGVEPGRWNVRCVAVVVPTIICFIHARFANLGFRIINSLSVITMVILIFIVISGMVGACLRVGAADSLLSHHHLDLHESLGATDAALSHLSTAQQNFSNIFAGSSIQPYDYATGLIKVLFCYRGYTTANQVISDLRNPAKTIRVAAPVALSLVSISYLLVMISFFLVIGKEDFRTSGIVIVGHFFRNMFGQTMGKNILPVFIFISAFGNIASATYVQSRTNQELGREGLLPFSDWSARRGLWETITPGLFLHWIVNVFVILAPPPGEIYNFLIDISGYPVSLISVSISLGLLYLQHHPQEQWTSMFHAKMPYTIIFAASNCLLLIMPWVKPKTDRTDSQFPYFAYPTTALAVMVGGFLYWLWWARIASLVIRSIRLQIRTWGKLRVAPEFSAKRSGKMDTEGAGSIKEQSLSA